jgi:WS/DGAT/MGAT family acyltransferase
MLRLDNRTNLMMVTGVLILGAPIELEQLRATLQARLLPFDRFRQRVVTPPVGRGRPYWEHDPGLDLDYHVRRMALPPPGDEAALQALVSQMISTPLDPDRPLWQFHLVEPYGQGCALICRVHHSLADGMALVHVLLSITESAPDAPPPHVPAAGRSGGEARPRSRAGIGRVRRAGSKLVRGSLQLMIHPSRVAGLAERSVQAARAVGGLMLAGIESETVSCGKLGVPKRVAWSAPIPLDQVNVVRRQLGGTVNDVLLAAVSGALRRYLLARGEEVDGVEIHAAVPVSMRPPGGPATLENKVGAILLALPLWPADPSERLRVIRNRMEKHKNSLEAPLVYAGLRVSAALPAVAVSPLLDYFSSGLTAVMTNVPGPRDRLYLAGSPVDAFMFWAPKVGRIGLGVSILTYAGEARLGVISDAELQPDPETMIAGFEAEFELLLAEAEKAAERVSIRSSLSILDDALRTLDGLLDGRP